jgi:hypothetical protein
MQKTFHRKKVPTLFLKLDIAGAFWKSTTLVDVAYLGSYYCFFLEMGEISLQLLHPKDAHGFFY